MFSSSDFVYNDEYNCLLVKKCLRKQSACELHGKPKWSSTTVPFGVWTQADKTKPLNIYRECNTRNIMLNEAIFSQVWPLLQTPADGKKTAYHSGHKVSWQSQIVNRSSEFPLQLNSTCLISYWLTRLNFFSDWTLPMIYLMLWMEFLWGSTHTWMSSSCAFSCTSFCSL